jgi:1,4-dihydroxy-2-naphthoate octaprenyltransferase
MSFFLEFIRIIRLGDLVSGVILYTLGGGVAVYLGVFAGWQTFWSGLGWIFFLLVSNGFLIHYFDRITQRNSEDTDGSGKKAEKVPLIISSNAILLSAFASLTGLAIMTVLLIAVEDLSLPTITFLIFSSASLFFYALPPFRLIQSGYGEIIIAFVITLLIPGISFLMQNNDYHRLLAMVSLPLFSAHLMMQLANELRNYAKDIQMKTMNMMTRAGWQTGIFILNISLLSIFLSLGIVMLFGLPVFIFIPGILLFPLGLLLFWQIRRILNGANPYWVVFSLTANGIFYLMAYLFTFAFWTN